MKFLGLDYGHKKIGIAVSDEEGRLAFPHSVIPTNGESLKKIISLCRKEKVDQVVMGESRDLKGQPNPVYEASRLFAESLSKELNIEVKFEPEFYTTWEAERILGRGEDLDARAAAIILRSFLEKRR